MIGTSSKLCCGNYIRDAVSFGTNLIRLSLRLVVPTHVVTLRRFTHNNNRYKAILDFQGL